MRHAAVESMGCITITVPARENHEALSPRPSRPGCYKVLQSTNENAIRSRQNLEVHKEKSQEQVRV